MMTSKLAVLAILMTSLHAHSQSIEVPEPEIPPWCSQGTGCNSQVFVESMGSVVQGVAQCRMGNDGIFNRPVILVEGFDFGNGWSPTNQGYGSVTWSHIHGADINSFPQGQDYRPLLDSLYHMGADLVFLDFAEGTSALQQKVALLNHLLSLIQDHKVGNEPGILVGVSMGGLVGRLGLKQWESAGTAHCIGQFISVDAPYLGSTIPVGIQALLLGLSTISQEGQDLWQALNSTAARQLLKHHIAGNEEHLAIQAMLAEVGWPTTSINLNIVNSRPNAMADLEPGPLLHLEWGLETPIEASLFHVTADQWEENNPLAGASLLLPGGLFTQFGSNMIQENCLLFPQPLDNPEMAPGSTASHSQHIYQSLNANMPFPLLQGYFQEDVTFVPYSSAVGDVASATSSIWSEISSATIGYPREIHASIGDHHRNWLIPWIKSLWDDQNPFGDITSEESSYTFNWERPYNRILQGVHIYGEGQIVIGDADSTFEARTSPCNGMIIVDDGGQLQIGSDSGDQGAFIIGNATALNAGEDGQVHVYNSSELIVDSHGLLNLEGGQIHVHSGGTLRMNPEGMIQSSQGGTIFLEPGSNFIFDGRLSILSFQELKIETSGMVNIGPNAKVWCGPSGQLMWNGDSNSFINIHGSPVFSGSGLIEIDNESLQFAESSHLLLRVNTEWTNSTLLGPSCDWPQIESNQNVLIDECEIGNLNWLHEGQIDNPSSIKMSDTFWSHGTLQSDSSYIRLWDNEMDHMHVEVNGPLHPSRFINNQWNNEWYSDRPSLEISNTEDAVWIENCSFHGGIGLSAINCSISSSCNAWSDCEIAVRLQDSTSSCFQPQCGGGSNRWVNNDVHFQLENAPLPSMNYGNNFYGSASAFVFDGTTSTNVTQWTLEGASWDASLLTNPWMSPLPTDLGYCSNGECTDISCWAHNMVAQTTCSTPTILKPQSKSMSMNQIWNILGQEIVTIETNSVQWQSGIHINE